MLLDAGAASAQRDCPAESSFLGGFVILSGSDGSCSSVNLPEGLIALLRQPSPCFLATLMPDGSPQMTQTWAGTDGEHVVINTVQGHQKVKNIERDPRVAVNVCDVSKPSRYYAIRGRVVSITAEGGAEHIRGPRSALPWRSLPVVRRSRPGTCHPNHQGRQDPRDGVGQTPLRLGPTAPDGLLPWLRGGPARPGGARVSGR